MGPEARQDPLLSPERLDMTATADPAAAAEADLEARFVEMARANLVNRAILDRLPGLGLPDCWLVSGCLFQTVWNLLTGRPPTAGIADYDLFYFDGSDLSWTAEDRVIARCGQAFADLGVTVQVRNQARVHLWYEAKFGFPYAPLRSSTEAIDRFLSPVCSVGLRPVAGGGFELYAPFGLSDIFAMIIRPNPKFRLAPAAFEAKAARWRKEWPGARLAAGTSPAG